LRKKMTQLFPATANDSASGVLRDKQQLRAHQKHFDSRAKR
jgi:hypothetical protein